MQMFCRESMNISHWAIAVRGSNVEQICRDTEGPQTQVDQKD